MSYNAHDLSNRLLNALDNNYNVVDMQAVNEIISYLEKFNITKELLETTRLGKHVNELRRKTSDPTLARRAKVLVKRWRDLVIPSVTSPGQTGSNRSSAERQVRRLGGTPLTSPALSRVVSPAVNSPRPPSRPAWGGYESDSQDVILVDDEPAPPPPPAPPAAPPPLAPLAPFAAHKPETSPVKRATSPVPLHDEKKAKRDKKPKKRRGHSRAGLGTEAGAGAAAGAGAGATTTAGPWPARNGTALPDRRRNGCKLDPYAALVNRMPPAGAKKVKTTQELLEEIQSRGSRALASPSPPASPDVMLIEPDPSPVVKVESPLRNGGSEPRVPSPAADEAPPSPLVPLEDERPYYECTCTGSPTGSPSSCPAAAKLPLRARHVLALHHALVPGVNGTRARALPHKFAVRKPEHPEWPGLFSSVVPLYKYSDYADDYCVKNMSSVPLCPDLPWSEFAPSPPSPPPPPPPKSPRPYPIDDPVEVKVEPEPPPPPDIVKTKPEEKIKIVIGPEPVSVPVLEPCERLKPPILTTEDEIQFGKAEPTVKPEVEVKFASEIREHRTVEKTKGEVKAEELDGRALVAQCERARAAAAWDYGLLGPAPELSLAGDGPGADGAALVALARAAAAAAADGTRDSLGRPPRPTRFAEWHESARLGDLVALPYVVID